MKTSPSRKKRIWGAMLAGFIFLLTMEENVLAATNKSGCEPGGTVKASYETEGQKANGYGLKSGKILVTYEMGEPSESCPNTSWQYVGITNQVEVPGIDKSETNVSGGGYSCNGHHSNTADWTHWFGRSGSILYGMDKENTGSVLVTEEAYKRCNYAIAGPSKNFGDGIEADGKFYWIVLYKKLPTEISKEGIDDTAPKIALQAVPSGITAVNSTTGKTYGTEALLSARITDNQARPHKTKTVRFKNSEKNITDWLSANIRNKTEVTCDIIVKENDTYYAESQDQLQNDTVSSGTTVDFIDKDKPVAIVGKEVNENIIVDGKEWTATNVTLFVSADDEGVGLAQTPYCFDDVTWTKSEKYVISQNGNYRIKVRDALGNVVEKNILINNFDKQAPVGEINTAYENGITIGDSVWSNKQVTLEIQAVDGGCGLDNEPYSYDGGATWTSENKISFTENGEKIVKIRDGLHNTMTKYIFIDGIDKTAPEIKEIQVTSAGNETKGAIVKVTAVDNADGCGMNDTAYSYDGGATWTDKNEMTVTETTVLNIQVRDKLLNTSTIMCPVKCTQNEVVSQDVEENKVNEQNEVSEESGNEAVVENTEENQFVYEIKLQQDAMIAKERENETDSNESTQTDSLENKSDQWADTVIVAMDYNETEKNVASTKPKNKQGQESTRTEESISENMLPGEESIENDPIHKETYQVDIPVLQDEKEPIIPRNYKKKTPSQKAFFVAVSLGTFFVGAMLLLLWYIVAVYKYKVILFGRQDGDYKKLGLLTIIKKEENLQIKVPEEMLQQVTDNFYRIKVSPVYVFSHEGEDVFLLVEDRMIKKQVERQIDFYFE